MDTEPGAVFAGRGQLDPRLLRGVDHEAVGHLQQHARAVAGIDLASAGTAVIEVLQDLDALLEDPVRGTALDVEPRSRRRRLRAVEAGSYRPCFGGRPLLVCPAAADPWPFCSRPFCMTNSALDVWVPVLPQATVSAARTRQGAPCPPGRHGLGSPEGASCGVNDFNGLNAITKRHFFAPHRPWSRYAPAMPAVRSATASAPPRQADLSNRRRVADDPAIDLRDAAPPSGPW